MRTLLTLTALLGTCLLSADVSARDFFLTIGGGYSPSGNQASIENNVLYSQRVLKPRIGDSLNHIYFADGKDPGADVEVVDPNKVPKANRLMAEFFGSSQNLGLSYRDHKVPNVRGATKPANVRKWFKETGSTIQDGDRLFVYVTAHGSGSRDRRNTHETTIAMWDNSSLKMTEFVGLLDELPVGVKVVCVMVQCHAGGFARLIYKGGDPNAGLSPQQRIGFFATVHDRQAAGCTSEVDEKTYVEYSTYFWAAVSGKDRGGNTIERPDYDGDGKISFEEAHAYVILTANTIDLPLKSSGEFLTKWGRYGARRNGLLTDDASYAEVLKVATPVQKAVLEGLSKQLKIEGDQRIMAAFQQTRGGNTRGGGGGRFRGGRRQARPGAEQKARIARDLKKRWPQLANVMNPGSIELITTRSNEFIQAIEQHKDYAEYVRLTDTQANSEQKRRVKFERFLRMVDNVIFAENLRRQGRKELVQQYEAIVGAEQDTLFD